MVGFGGTITSDGGVGGCFGGRCDGVAKFCTKG